MRDSFAEAGKTYAEDVHNIERQAQQWWQDEHIDAATALPGSDKQYILGMFPYPSGNAHMGHVRVYSITDLIARHARFKGADVLHPLAWDSFGLPAENAAFKNKVHPADWTQENIRTMRDEQIGRVGFSFTPNREFATSAPDYYKWTQWLFLTLYEHGKVYRAKEWVNWDPVDQTVLANEQVIDGKGWRSGVPIERRQMEQWYIRITDYAEELALGVDKLEGWSDAAKSAQKNWIGRKEGAHIYFDVPGKDLSLAAFTERPELIYGTTAIVIAPENDVIEKITEPGQKKDVEDYVRAALLKSEVERSSAKEKTGIFTGAYATHPLTGAKLPVYVADYVLTTYGKGVSLCIPAHNERDHDFAQTMDLPMQPVLSGAETLPFTDEKATLINSEALDGLNIEKAREKIITQLTDKKLGEAATEYRLRDWSLSRQRFWGAPIPMLKDRQGKWHPLPESALPVELPREVDFSQSNGKSPLATNESFRYTTDPQTGEAMEREIDTMDTFMCSAWYAWRFVDAQNDKQAWDPEKAKAWMPIDTYVGGLEHANQHMIYFRFMSYFLHEIGLTNTQEPIKTFLDNGLVRMNGEKMSKSKGNVVRPDDMVDKYSADALRMYILSDAPFSRDIDWNESGLAKKFTFLKRLHTLYGSAKTMLPKGILALDSVQADDPWVTDLLETLQKTTDKIDQDITEHYNFNSVIARTHELANKLFDERKHANTDQRRQVYGFAMQSYLKILGLTAPHLADHLFRNTFGVEQSLFTQPWIDVPDHLLASHKNTIEVPVMINGRKRGMVEINPAHNDNELQQQFMAGPRDYLQEQFRNATVQKVIIVRDRANDNAPKLINLVLAR